MEENTQGNPKAVDDNVFGSDGEDFFSALDQDVNGLVQDDEPETKQAATPGIQDPANNKKAETVSQSSEVNTELENLKKRYSDSSREAQQLKAQLDQLKPYAPVLEAMKQDENLVSHVKDYFQKGGQPTDDIRKQLSLEEDFEFDPDEMVSNPNSDSRKVFDSMVNNIVNKKANEVVNQQRAAIAQSQQQQTQAAQAKEFMEKHGMTKVEFQEFAREAQAKIANGGITYDDMYMLVNQGKVNQNVANATKNDMLNQMQNVRNIPASQSASNNAGNPVSQNDNVFDALLNSDGNIEELLG